MLANKLMSALAEGTGGTEEKLNANDVFSTYSYTGNGSTQTINNGIDLAGKGGLVWIKNRTGTNVHILFDTARQSTGNKRYLSTNNTLAESGDGYEWITYNSAGFTFPSVMSGVNNTGASVASWTFRRAPKFFDVVTYTGNGTTTQNIAHSLGVHPLFIIVKRTDSTSNWFVRQSYMAGNNNSYISYTGLELNNSTKAGNQGGMSYDTATTFRPASTTDFDQNCPNVLGANYVAYLFASLPGISNVGSYAGNGTTQTINCGFSTGARFILIKRMDSTGDWYVWDTARGIVAANDPHLSLNTTAAEVTTDDSVDPHASGFIVNQVAATNINVSGAWYIFLAIA